MDNKVSECYKTFDKKHNLEKIDSKNTLKDLIKSSKNKRLNENYFSFFIGETSRTGPFSVILRFQQSLSPSSTFNRWAREERLDPKDFDRIKAALDKNPFKNGGR